MEKLVLNVEGMSCAHCEARVKKAVSALSGVDDVSVSLADKTVSVSFEPSVLEAKAIREAIEEQGYDVKS
ncbi:MAG: copper ion binding protein [Oscillospiraceae bacterium]|nr:copper ion binding protein [Oscillospiraceae bacterium]